ncbi:hypothetical protein Calkro_2048 [Caldicellulosiruptor kronotskyensis 2002]|uniref:PAS domain-containing protein n=1 Tax=Caldicellulosiruptor kronotskyensis (strain DSM 18902 / VKM B-2412 / 2002) TaxID=632348 RepID=E4SGL6_CALK2|nr:PAS domain-containing protein [Caldicellulosiruptor kronotskyensis]ADQ46891.1 hypothetical protein Calkro_2048 [Caldicellulosiruptor kronotskyensis 2002]
MNVEKKRGKELIENNKVKFFVENLKDYFGNMNEYVVVVWDEEGVILEYKENGEKLLGYFPDQIEGKKWLDVLIDDREREEMEWVCRKLESINFKVKLIFRRHQCGKINLGAFFVF